MDGCEECGFDFETIEAAEIAPRTRAAVANIAAALSGDPTAAGRRPSPERWSALEYGAHIRDVMLTLRERAVVGLVEDYPGFPSMCREERIELDLYRNDTVADVVPELEAAASMFLRLFAAIDPSSTDRLVRYGHPDPSPRSVLWMAKQVVHEAEHHLGDIQQNASL